MKLLFSSLLLLLSAEQFHAKTLRGGEVRLTSAKGRHPVLADLFSFTFSYFDRHSFQFSHTET
jgi:hypothetical protein